MRQATAKIRQAGFTLVELLIVAIILAILAAIVVPQFASTTTDAQEAALRANLSAIRGAISLYRQQHNEYPGAVAATGGTCGGTAGSGAAETRAALVEQLTRYSNASGETCSRPESGSFPFGPYLDENDIPANPVTGNNAVAIVPSTDAAAGDLAMQGAGAGLGWRYDPTSGKFIANDTDTDSQGTRYDAY
ncbi:MAG: prepilin-type N-terminal cleavage/methylation domain-containing protein [Gammaproteobacteria bacterium]|nr:prepilin-type N-terminal cleavage/methylation domain-containing protein [Gammaproteobacteria bacterium]